MITKTLITTAISLSLIGGSLVSMETFARGPGGHGGPGAAGGGVAPTQRMTLLERLDEDGDGVLSLEEFAAGSTDKAERRFDRMDTDGDDLLSLEEFTAAPPRGRHPGMDELDEEALTLCMEEALGYELPERPDSEAAFTQADANGDALVDADEFSAASDLRAEERFAEIDGDASGDLTSEELEAFGLEKQARREAHRSCVEEQLNADDILN